MDEAKFKKGLDQLRKDSKKRNFAQSVELIVNIKDINLKNPDEHIDVYTTLPYSRGKDIKICALVGPELEEEANANCTTTITQHDFDKYKKDKKLIKKLAEEHDFFIAQANIMPAIAGAFGAVLGPKKKMPNPKAGCIVPPKTALKPLIQKLSNTVKMQAKEKPLIQISVGKESAPDDQLIKNMVSAFNALVHVLPKELNNVKSIFIKYTMSKPVKIE